MIKENKIIFPMKLAENFQHSLISLGFVKFPVELPNRGDCWSLALG